ncbi:MAG: SpoVA/SpoVAEb family sporulation membrane protein [Firmicutes bacterium]|nr:SpoVA/SpoVAEb family sporulation membrane protein [Bacillota bacterium]
MTKKKIDVKHQSKDEARNQRYNQYVNAVTPQTGTAKSLFHSFLVGGLICLIGEILFNLIRALFPAMSEIMAGHLMVMVLIVAAIFLTGLGIYDVMARKGGAGMFLPISGFANAMASASMEHKSEGLIMGTSVKLFSVVGPVLVNGIVWSSLAGLIRLLLP